MCIPPIQNTGKCVENKETRTQIGEAPGIKDSKIISFKPQLMTGDQQMRLRRYVA